MKLIEQDIKLPITEVRLEGGSDQNQIQRHSKLFPKNVRGLIVGPSSSGKTCALLSLIYDKSGLAFKNIYLFSKSLFQPKYEELGTVLKSVPEIGFYTYTDSEEVPPPQDVAPSSLVVFDDIALEPKSQIRAYYCMGRHCNLDMIYLNQSFAQVPKLLLRDNMNVILLFKMDCLNLKHVYSDYVMGDMKFDEFCEMCKLAWDRPYGCLGIFRDFPLNSGRYRVGFDTYITL
jgi:hypothetical protein